MGAWDGVNSTKCFVWSTNRVVLCLGSIGRFYRYPQSRFMIRLKIMNIGIHLLFLSFRKWSSSGKIRRYKSR